MATRMFKYFFLICLFVLSSKTMAHECEFEGGVEDHWARASKVAVGVIQAGSLNSEMFQSRNEKKHYDQKYEVQPYRILKGADFPKEVYFSEGFPGVGLSIGYSYVLFYYHSEVIDLGCGYILELNYGKMDSQDLEMLRNRKDISFSHDLNKILALADENP